MFLVVYQVVDVDSVLRGDINGRIPSSMSIFAEEDEELVSALEVFTSSSIQKQGLFGRRLFHHGREESEELDQRIYIGRILSASS